MSLHRPRLRGRLAAAALLAALGFVLPADTPAQDRATKWMRLWNGKDLQGWRYLEKYFHVDSGMIIGKGHLTGFNTFCTTRDTFSDFELSFRARLWEVNPWYTNSGVQYRSRYNDSAKKNLQGYQLEIGGGGSGGMYPEQGYPTSQGQGTSSACRSAFRKNQWNHYQVIANGSRIIHKLNGAQCVDYSATVLRGVIGLQMHFLMGSFTEISSMEVNFKDLYIRPLNNSFAVPDSLAILLEADYTGTVGLASQGRLRTGRGPRWEGSRLVLGGLSPGARFAALDPLGRLLGVSTPADAEGRAGLPQEHRVPGLFYRVADPAEVRTRTSEREE